VTAALMKSNVLWDLKPYSLVDICQTTFRHIPEDSNFYSHHREDLRSHTAADDSEPLPDGSGNYLY
jgi:hypothetical protein